MDLIPAGSYLFPTSGRQKRGSKVTGGGNRKGGGGDLGSSSGTNVTALR